MLLLYTLIFQDGGTPLLSCGNSINQALQPTNGLAIFSCLMDVCGPWPG
jgi:hypothetical protein